MISVINKICIFVSVNRDSINILVVDTTMAGLHSLHPTSFMKRILYRYSVQASKCSNRCCFAYPLEKKHRKF